MVFIVQGAFTIEDARVSFLVGTVAWQDEVGEFCIFFLLKACLWLSLVLSVLIEQYHSLFYISLLEVFYLTDETVL